MKISRHIHYFQNPDSCLRKKLTFNPPIEVESTLEKIDHLYAEAVLSRDGNSNRAEKAAKVINPNGMLVLADGMKPGGVASHK